MSDTAGIVQRLKEAQQQLTGPGAPFEIEERQLNGVALHSYKNAPVTLRDALAEGRKHGDKVFLTFAEERYSFDEFFAVSDRLANAMVKQYEISKGDRVAIAMRNYPEWMMAFAAIASIGAVVVPLNSWGQAPELEYALGDAGAKLLICDQQRAAYVADRLAALGCRAILVRGENTYGSELIDSWASTQQAPPEIPDVDIASGDLAMIMYTSGTTGNPKGAASANFNVCQALFNFEVHACMSAMANPDTVGAMMASGFDSATLLSVPLFHVSGCYAVFMLNLRGGRKISIMNKWDPMEALKIIETEHITIFTGVPTMIMALLDSPAFAETDTSSLYSLGTGGTACPPHLSKLIYDKIPHAYPGTGYGMTETNAICACATGEAFRLRPEASGTLSPIVECKTVDENGEDLPPGETGELYIRSPANVQQYWNLPSESAETFKDGWVASGDVGYIDSEGFLYVVDRIKDMVIRGGENIYPIEIEGILLSHPQVTEAAVFGVPHERLGEELVASVCVKGSVRNEALRYYLGERIAGFKVPAQIKISTLPLAKNATGKLLKKVIRQDYLNGL